LCISGVVTPPDDSGRRPAPNLAAAGLAIDALTALVDGLKDRLGEGEEMLREALARRRCSSSKSRIQAD
jgi:hypothetical protein